MKYNLLGKTNIKVSKLCYGGLTMGPLQSGLDSKAGARLIEYAYGKGINFIDTAELYDTYDHIKEGLKLIGKNNLVVSTKSYAYDTKTAEESLKKALEGIGRDYVDLFLMHEQESDHTIRGHYEALEYFLRMKEKGYIRALGLSTHKVEAVEASLKYDEIEVLHPIINKFGIGIQDGDAPKMLSAIKRAHAKGKGIYGMKAIGGGNLISKIEECFDYILSIDELDSIAIGMQHCDEIDYNVLRFEESAIPDELKQRLGSRDRRLHIESWCTLCGNCVRACKHKALSKRDKILVDKDKCVTCGYCGAYCEDFCIKVL